MLGHKFEFSYVPRESGIQTVHVGNVKYGYSRCGEIYQEVDGFWVYSMGETIGYLDSWFLRGIADKLDELNKDWQVELLGALSKVKEPTEVFDV